MSILQFKASNIPKETTRRKPFGDILSSVKNMRGEGEVVLAMGIGVAAFLGLTMLEMSQENKLRENIRNNTKCAHVQERTIELKNGGTVKEGTVTLPDGEKVNLLIDSTAKGSAGTVNLIVKREGISVNVPECK